MGLVIDPVKNNKDQEKQEIFYKWFCFRIFVIPTNEEYVIANDTYFKISF